jgi:hypothetical protein
MQPAIVIQGNHRLLNIWLWGNVASQFRESGYMIGRKYSQR